MKRLVNVRTPVILAIALVVGITVGCLFSYFGISLFWLTAVIPITAVIVIIFTLFSKWRPLIITLLAGLFMATGIVSGFVILDNYGRSRLTDGGIYTLSASVSEKGENLYGEYIVINNVKADEQKIVGKIIVYLGETYGDFCDVGYKVNFTAEIKRKDAFVDGKINYYIQENIKYSCSVYGGMTAKYGYSFFGSIRSHIRDTLYNSLDKDTAAIAFAMLTGNTQGVDDGAMTSFRYGGIAHVFAVSGLHIGIIYGILFAIFKKVRINKFIKAAICILPLFFYAGVCGFTLSSVRAAVMCTVAALARLTHKKYDPLNSLSLSVIIILLVTPLSLFSAGFQLSVCATGAIILLYKNISKLFKKLPKKLADAVGVSLSAQLGTLPVMLTSFGYLSGASLLMNIIFLPVLSAIYVLLFIVTVIAAVIPLIGVILPYATLPLQVMVSAILNLGFENAIISGSNLRLFTPVFYIGLLTLSDKINLSLLQRVCFAVIAASALCICVLIG